MKNAEKERTREKKEMYKKENELKVREERV